MLACIGSFEAERLQATWTGMQESAREIDVTFCLQPDAGADIYADPGPDRIADVHADIHSDVHSYPLADRYTHPNTEVRAGPLC